MAITETVVLAIISLGALIIFQRYEGTRKFAAAAMKGAPRAARQHLERRCAPAGDDRCGRVCSDFGAPVATLLLVSFAQEGSWTTQTLPAAYTFANYQRIFGDTYAAEVFFNSLTMSAIAAVAALLWSFASSLCYEGRKQPAGSLRGMASTFVVAGFDSVGIAGNCRGRVGIEAYGGPSWLLGSFVLVGTFWILPVVYFLRFMPLVRVRALQASMEQVDPTLRGSGGFARRSRVAEIHARDPPARVARRCRGHPAGICDRVRRICGFGVGVCARKSTHFHRDCI